MNEDAYLEQAFEDRNGVYAPDHDEPEQDWEDE